MVATLCDFVVDRLVGHRPVAMDSILLPEHHPKVVRHLRQLTANAERAKAVGGTASAFQPVKKQRTLSTKHYDSFRKAGIDWSAPSPFPDPRTLELYLGIHQLSDRQVDILDRNGIRVPEAKPLHTQREHVVGLRQYQKRWLALPQYWKRVVVGPQGALFIWC
jgi:hypothetical protein